MILKKHNVLLLVSLIMLQACSSVPVLPEKKVNYKVSNELASNLARYTEPLVNANSGKTGVFPLLSGVDAFVARLAVVKAAEHSIDLQYYIYRADDTGKLLLSYLLEAADRGVRVRILLDDLTTKGADDGLMLLASHPNIQVRLFNPSFERYFRSISMITGFSRLNSRMHNKSLTVDNQITIVGGRNIGDEYFSNNSDVDFGDFDLLTIGSAVDQVSDQFDDYWNAPLAVEISALNQRRFDESELAAAELTHQQQRQILQQLPYVERMELSELLVAIRHDELQWSWGNAEVLYDPPNKVLGQHSEQWMMSELSRFFARAEREILLVSPYFVPTKQGVDAILATVEAGVKVTVVTNSLAATDVLAVHAGYQPYRKRLLEGGVALYEVKVDPLKRPSAWQGSSRSSLHAKTFIIDREAIFVGSFNFDPRSANINTELGLVVDVPQLSYDLQQSIEQLLKKTAYRLRLKDGDIVWHDQLHDRLLYAEPRAGFWRKFLVDLIGLFPIESQL
ncbi:phospholipase D family protein [Shewanella waksmanii]|uniref:phospholipase D family protein n=1 Tax=Shewanella waksmanii TaxID=213783 RepID=UPI003735B0E2